MQTFTISVPQDVSVDWDFKVKLPSGNWEFVEAFRDRTTMKTFAQFTNKETGALLNKSLDDIVATQGDMEADCDNEWVHASAYPEVS